MAETLTMANQALDLLKGLVSQIDDAECGNLAAYSAAWTLLRIIERGVLEALDDDADPVTALQVFETTARRFEFLLAPYLGLVT
jgi:hypothetical protein